MILGIEIAMIVVGILAIVRGKMTVTGNKVVIGTPARLLRALALTPLPAAFMAILAYVAINAPADPERFAQDKKWTIIGIEAAIVIGIAVLVFGIGAAIGIDRREAERIEQRRRRYEEEEEEYEDDGNERERGRRLGAPRLGTVSGSQVVQRGCRNRMNASAAGWGVSPRRIRMPESIGSIWPGSFLTPTFTPRSHRAIRHERHERHAQPRLDHLDHDARRGGFHVDSRRQPAPVERIQDVLAAGGTALEDNQRHINEVGQRQIALAEERVARRGDEAPIEREEMAVFQARSALVGRGDAECQIGIARSASSMSRSVRVLRRTRMSGNVRWKRRTASSMA